MQYGYDAASRLTQIVQGSQVVDFQHDALGRRTQLRLPNQVTTDYQYDAASRLTALIYRNALGPLGDLAYEYNGAGNRTRTTGSFARTGQPQPVASATYNAANHQLTFGGQALAYDLNGNLISDGTNTYTWNPRDQLIGISGPTIASFQYDPLGRRTRKTVDGTTTDFHYDGLNPVQELSNASVVANLLTGLGIDEYFTRTDAAATSTFLTDALGSTLALIDSTGNVQTQYTYEAFGNTTAAGLPSTNPFQYTGLQHDGTSLYYARARHYHPGFARFISEDPIEFAGGDVNLYTYVWNAPTSYIDPWGLGGAFIVGGRGGAYVRPSHAQSPWPKTNPTPPPRPTPQPTPKSAQPDAKGQPARGQDLADKARRPGLNDPNEPHPPHPHPPHTPPDPGGTPGPPVNPFCYGGGMCAPSGPPSGGRKDPPPLPPGFI